MVICLEVVSMRINEAKPGFFRKQRCASVEGAQTIEKNMLNTKYIDPINCQGFLRIQKYKPKKQIQKNKKVQTFKLINTQNKSRI